MDAPPPAGPFHDFDATQAAVGRARPERAFADAVRHTLPSLRAPFDAPAAVRHGRRVAASLACVALLARGACAQQAVATAAGDGGPHGPSSSFACNGETITGVDIKPGRPPFAGSLRYWRAAARAVGLHHATTRSDVIASFLQFAEGEPCSPVRLSESERLLRAQPFLADASVRAVPDSAGTGVRIEVETVDEIPALASLRLHGASLAAIALGNEDVGGHGVRAEAGVERGGAYRTPVFGEVEAHALAGQPIDALARVERRRVGGGAELDVAYPFMSDLQRGGWHVAWRRADDFFDIARPADDGLAIRVRHWDWQAGAVAQRHLGGAVALLGGALSGVQVQPDSRGTLVSETGLAPDTGTALVDRYAAMRAVRLGSLLGLRRVRYVTVDGFDALTGPQDVARGVQISSYVARSLGMSGANDLFVSGSLYAGAVTPRSMLATLAEVESRRPFGASSWDGTIGSARTAWYWGGAPGGLLVLSDELSGGFRSRLPLQITFADPAGGVRGYGSSLLAGARRNVARAELRWSFPAAVHRADLGIAAFSDVGTLWAGDAPYGVNTTRASVGVSIMSAYPTRSKRLYRVDFAVPLDPTAAGRRIEIRFSAADHTARFWQEPDDIARSRLGAEPSRLFEWPGGR